MMRKNLGKKRTPLLRRSVTRARLYEQLLHTLPICLIFLEAIYDDSGDVEDYIIIKVEGDSETLIGYPPSTIVGRNASCLSQEIGADLVLISREVLLSGVPDHGAFYNALTKRYLNLHVFRPKRDHMVFSIVDSITSGTDEKSLHIKLEEANIRENLLTIQRDLSQVLGTSSTLAQAMEYILESALTIPFVDCGGIYLVDDQKNLSLVAHRGLSKEFVQSSLYYPAMSDQAKLVTQGKPIYSHYNAYHSIAVDVRRREGLRAIAILPVVFDSEVIAALNLSSKTCNSFSPSTQMALEALAERIDGILARIRLQETQRESQASLESVFDSIKDPLFVVSVSDGRLLASNRAAATVLGYGAEDMEKLSVFDIHPPTSHALIEDLLKKIEAGQESTCDISLSRCDGSLIPVETVVSLGVWHGQSVIIGISRDISSRVKMETALRESEERFRSIFLNSKVGMGLFDTHGNFLEANPAGMQIFNAIGESCREVEVDKLFEHATVPFDAKRRIEEGETVRYQTVLCFPSGQSKHIDVSMTANLVNGHLKGILVQVQDITERRMREAQLEFLSRRDRLTGVYNRLFAEEYLKNIELAQTPAVLILGDVNGLKLINDTFGREEGDSILSCLSYAFLTVVGERGLTARWGGDEFLVVLPHLSDMEAKGIVSEVRNYCAKQSKSSLPISVGLGYALTDHGSEVSIEEVLRKAEERMHRNKLMEGKSARSAIISTLRETLSAKTIETEEHCIRMENLARIVAQKMALPEAQHNELLLLALLHDIGKVGVPESILSKPSALTPEEVKEVKKHPEIGYRIAVTSCELAHVAEGILHHHEWWNGQGYPHGLSGESIPLSCRIISVIDAYDAMVSARPYRPAMHPCEAIEELQRYSGSQFDPQVVELVVEAVTASVDTWSI